MADSFEFSSTKPNRKISVSTSDHDIGSKAFGSGGKLIGDLDTLPVARCQQIVARLARGQRVSTDERVKTAFSLRLCIRTNSPVAKALATHLFADENLREWFQRLFEPERPSSFGVPSSSNIRPSVEEVWDRFYCYVLPDLHSVLYPYEELGIQTRPPVRVKLLAAFRDVLLAFNQPTTRPCSNTAETMRMLLILEQTTRDNSANYAILKRICDGHFGAGASWCLPSTPPKSPRRSPTRRKMAAVMEGHMMIPSTSCTEIALHRSINR